MIDFKKLADEPKKDIIDPSIIFASLPNKAKKYGYLRQVQGEVLDQWFQNRDQKNNIIKMNTGSGKTTVALLILQSCLNEKKGNAVYVVPDKYLISQVKEEAQDLGINVTLDTEDVDYIRGKSILIINVQKLINGKTIFNKDRKIDNIVIDDVHACLDIAEQQFNVQIMREKYPKLYQEISDLFSSELEKQNYSNKMNVYGIMPNSNVMIVPFWEVREKYKTICDILEKYVRLEGFEEIMFPYEFLKDIIQYCNICISFNKLEISPDCIPINKIPAFCDASRRIFVSATLKDDGRLLQDFDINPEEIKTIITPNNGMDIGNRMILFPQAINPVIKDIEIKMILKEISKDKRIIVIVPSSKRSKFWEDVADRIFQKENIEEIKKYNTGLDILVNRYDGIDLKDDLCSILVIDGLPKAKSLFEEVKESLTRDTADSLQEKIQKIEQGMGRGIRSSLDNCAVIIMGKELLNILYNQGALDNFSESTKKQFELSERAAEQLKNHPLNEIMETLDLCLNRDNEWLTIMSDKLSEIIVEKELRYSEDSIKLTKAYRYALNNNFEKSIEIIQKIANSESNKRLKGYYMYQLSKYMDFKDSVNAQQILVKAKENNSDVCIPRDGYDYTPLRNKNLDQSQNIINMIKNDYENDPRKYLYAIESVFSNLVFSETAYNIFETNINELCKLLGFEGNMPERETGKGPDNFWNLGNSNFFVIECKNEATTDFISKDDCGQLSVSLNWAENKYGSDSIFTGIMIHRSNAFNFDAIPDKRVRIIQECNIKKLEENLKEFLNYLQKETINVENISKGLNKYNLTSANFAKNYTIKYEIKGNN